RELRPDMRGPPPGWDGGPEGGGAPARSGDRDAVAPLKVYDSVYGSVGGSAGRAQGGFKTRVGFLADEVFQEHFTIEGPIGGLDGVAEASGVVGGVGDRHERNATRSGLKRQAAPAG